MANLVKDRTKLDSAQTQEFAFNDSDKSLTTSTFISSKVGNKIERATVSASVDDYSYFDGTNLLYTLRVTYTSSAKDEVNSVERIA